MANPFRHLRVAVLGALLACGARAAPIRPAEAPPGRMAFRTYDAANGLSNLAVWHIVQDQEGFIWIGTEAGLFRYGGTRFQPFGLKDGLLSTDILALHSDPAGTLWVGTRTGLARWNGQTFRPVEPKEGLPQVVVAGLADAPSGGLGVATTSGPFLRQPSGGFLKVPGWKGGEATAICGGRQTKCVWVASWEGRSAVHAFRNGEWKVYGPPAGWEKERVDSLAEDGKGRIWAKTPRTLWVLDPDGDRFHPAVTPFPFLSDRGFMEAGRHGDIWVPTNQGLAHLEGDAWTVLGSKEGLPTSWCQAVLEDREGNLWVGSVGVHRLLGNGAWRNYTQTDGLPSGVVWRIVRDRGGALWVGTDKGLARATAKGWEVLPGTGGHVVRTAVEGPDGALYLAGVPGNEVLRYDPRSKRVERIELGGNSAAKRIFRLMFDRSGALWACTDGAGLFMAPPGDGTPHFHPVSLPGGSPEEYISDILQDSAGRIWAGAEWGLALLENGSWRRLTIQDGLLRNHVAYVQTTRDGDLLLAYYEPVGLSRMRYEGGTLKTIARYSTASGLAEDKVYLTGEDAAGRLWVGTGQGVDLFLPEGIEHFGVAEGLVGEDCDNMAFFPEENGDVWIGTSAGLSRFAAQSYHGLEKAPPTSFVSLRLGQESFAPGPAKVQVPFGSNIFEVKFAGLGFRREAAVNQQVRLVGLEPAWRLTENQEARYAALPNGRYRFEVASRVGQGPWGPMAAFEFEVLPAWWQTWWFRGIVGLAFAGVVVLVVRWRLRALRRQNRQLEEQVALRTRELEAANEALRNQSLTDPLTGLRNRRFLGECIPADVAQVNRLNWAVKGPGLDRMALNIDLLFVMVDLDHFKVVNDEHGHTAGDKVLQQMGEIMKLATRDTDTVVRWGGEEFLVVARNVCRRDSTILVERIRSLVAMHEFDIGDGKSLHLTCSLGYAFYPFIPEHPQSVDWERVVDAADHCLYAAKRAGRDAWVGLLPGEESGEDVEVNSHELDIPGLLERRTLLVKSTLPAEAALEWDLKA